jgi:hypothetical protein
VNFAALFRECQPAIRISPAPQKNAARSAAFDASQQAPFFVDATGATD